MRATAIDQQSLAQRRHFHADYFADDAPLDDIGQRRVEAAQRGVLAFERGLPQGDKLLRAQFIAQLVDLGLQFLARGETLL